MLVAYRVQGRAVFLYGFAKNDRENIDADELLTVREVGAGWLSADAERIERAIVGNEQQEIFNGEKTS